MEHQGAKLADRYWVIGGRWVNDAKHLVWPRVLGPYDEYQSAHASAETLNLAHEPSVRYVVVADVAAAPLRTY